MEENEPHTVGDISVRYKNDARDPLHICQPPKFGSLPMLCGAPASVARRAWIKIAHEWPMNHRRMSMIDGRFKARRGLQLNDRNSMARVCPPGRFRAKHSCLACESGQETACLDQSDF